MKTQVIWIMALLAAGSAWAAITVPEFDRYKVILDRKPFGELAPPVAAQAPQVPPSETVTKFFRVCSLVKEDDGTILVGIVDSRGPKVYTLRPGGAEDGIKVIEANYEKENATIQVGDEPAAVLEIKTGAITPAAGEQPQNPNQPQAQGQGGPRGRNGGGRGGGGDQNNQGQGQNNASYQDRRRQRMEQQQQQQAQAQPQQPKYTGEALQQHLQDYNAEVIRQGLPPLPIPLTPEQDAQLVKEGVLPAAP